MIESKMAGIPKLNKHTNSEVLFSSKLFAQKKILNLDDVKIDEIYITNLYLFLNNLDNKWKRHPNNRDDQEHSHQVFRRNVAHGAG